ncbi:MPT63 family protein [Mycobacterium avium]|nr:MPT63 family protein [Mycobacterium avium]MCA4711659.1 MPT63 family protein [Mycobacterium avium subsp. hominissuis]MCA2261373.1 MPT63 family protein [Mycobacterium avium]MCA2271200.1 MPT63 family protein [Mycobacterium avium]MCA2281504.1 MPT63 family protein [Mycobacterium avium]
MVAAATAAACVVCAPPAIADDSVNHTLGSAAELTNGDVVQAWTVSDLKPSSDVIPYPVAGTLWEATATDHAVRGTVTPIVSNLNARARSGQTYRVLFGVATPQGVNPSTLPQGQKATGKVYFDVTGDAPDSVLYNAGGPDLAVWVQPPPAPPRSSSTGTGSYTSPGSGAATAAPAGSAPASPTPTVAPAATPADADSPGAPPQAGSQGTPLPPVSQGTPLPAGSQGTPSTPAPATPGAPTTTAATPAPAGADQTPAPSGAGSSGTPVTHGGAAQSPGTVAPAPPSTTVVVPPPAT